MNKWRLWDYITIYWNRLVGCRKKHKEPTKVINEESYCLACCRYVKEES